MEWLNLFESSIWFSFAALGFAVLFNVPKRTLWTICILAFVGGFVKLKLLQLGSGLIFATLGGASTVGILSIQAAHYKHSPNLVFSIPAVIPMVPGLLAYRMMMGIVQLVGEPNEDIFIKVFSEVMHNALTVTFVAFSLSIGVAIPMLITRKNSVKFIKFRR